AGGGAVAALSEVQAWRGGWARHFSLMLAMAASVVKSLPAMRSIMSRPRAASRRNPEAVIAPPGNATAAAMSNLSGSFGPISWGITGTRDMEFRPACACEYFFSLWCEQRSWAAPIPTRRPARHERGAGARLD